MDLQPETLLDLPMVANLVKMATTAFASAAMVAAGCVIVCVGRECRQLTRWSRQRSSGPVSTGSPASTTSR